MARNTDTIIVERDTGGTIEFSFKATDVAEYWPSAAVEESDNGKSGESFTKEDFEQALKQVSRKVKK